MIATPAMMSNIIIAPSVLSHFVACVKNVTSVIAFLVGFAVLSAVVVTSVSIMFVSAIVVELTVAIVVSERFELCDGIVAHSHFSIVAGKGQIAYSGAAVSVEGSVNIK